MASRQSGSSILKPSKVRAPLKEIESVDQDADEDTATMPKRKVSFSGMNKIKMYNTGATSLTVHQAPMFDEQISMLSDSSNGEKTKSSGKFEKSEGHITFESTNCTNMEENGRVIIEYESPSDNMEMTEAFPGKILSDTVYTNDTNSSVKNDYSLDYSANNMEFTGVMGHILTSDISYSSSTEMSDTLTNENEEHPESQFKHNTSIQLQDTLFKNTSHPNSSNMDITFANQKPYSMDLSCTKHQSNCMELTSMSLIPQKSMCLNDDYNYKSCNISELTQPNKQLFENDCEFIYEYDQCSVNMESETTCEIKEQSNYEAKIIENIIVPTELLEVGNCSNRQIISCKLENFDNNEETSGKCSSNGVAMDIDPVSEDNEYDISYVNIDGSKLVVNDQKNLTMPKMLEVENKKCPVNDVLDVYSNLIEIINEKNSSFEVSMTPTSSSFVQNMFSVENDMIESFEVNKQSEINTLNTHTSILGQSFEKDIEIEENNVKKYSRKSMRYTAPLMQENSSENNTVLSDTSVIFEANQQGYSKPSNNLTSVFNQTPPKEFEDYSDTSAIVEEKQEIKYSRKSIVPTSVFEEILSRENEEFSNTFAEDQHEKYANKSIVSSISVFDQSQSNEDNTSDSSALVKDQQERHCRKSIKPTSVFHETLFKENEYLSDTSSVVEEYQQKQYSGLPITSPISAFSPTQFKKSDSLVSSAITKDQYKRYSKKSIVPTSVFNQILSKENEDLSNTTAIDENHQKQCSKTSSGPVSLILTSNEFSEDSSLSCNSLIVKESDKKNLMISASEFVDNFSSKLSLVSNNSEVHQFDLSDNNIKSISKSENQLVLTNVIANDDFNSPFRKKSRKSIVPTQFLKQSVYDACNENIEIELTDKENQLETNEDSISEDTEYVSKMDISAEIEPAHYNVTNIITEKTNITSSSLLNNISIFKKKSTIFDTSPTKDINPNVDTLQETKQLNENNVCVDDMYEINKENMVSYALEKNKTNLNESTENNTLLKECNDKKINNTSVTHNMDKTTNETCIEDLSNKSISDNISEKSVLENRKRSYANRDCVPLLSSSFMFKPNAHGYINDSTKKDFLNESPIKTDVSCEISMNTVPQIENVIEVDIIKVEPVKEDLNNEVVEFLTRWNNIFVENKLALNKCTNSEWIFNVLDNNIKLVIKYSPISNDHSYLKVEDILLITQMITENEIITFGINWILSKYSPKVYKQICFTSRDVELLLKSLLEDIQFISMVMNNMVFVRDVYCVTFKDNKAQFVLQSMHPLLMSCVEISLANIHRLSVKDITIDCLFGCFDTKVLDNIIENVTIDCYILQSLIEKLRNSICIH